MVEGRGWEARKRCTSTEKIVAAVHDAFLAVVGGGEGGGCGESDEGELHV